MSTHNDKSETIYIGCQCHAPEHLIRVSYYEWVGKDEPELYFMLQSDKGHLNFWERLKMAAKFLIGRADVEWHDVIPDHNDIVELKRVLDTYTEDYKLYEETQTNGRN
jgi:hypothetical protein